MRCNEKIEETCSDKLQEIFQEGDSHAVGKLVRGSWKLDKLNAKENFFKDQIKKLIVSAVNNYNYI